MAPACRKIRNIFFTICIWPNWPIRAKILPRFQFEGKTDVWIIQVRRVKMSTCTKDYSCQLKVLMFDHNFILVVDITETFNFTHSETMHEIDHEEVFIIAKPICQQMDNRSKKQDAWLTNGSVVYLHRVHTVCFGWFLSGLEEILNLEFCY